MNLRIRERLTLQFTLIVTSILLVFATGIYLLSSSYREQEFYTRLETKALTTARLLIEVKEVDNNMLKIIDRNSINAMFNEKVLVYDSADQLIYSSVDDDTIPMVPERLDEIRKKGQSRFHIGLNEALGLRYNEGGSEYVVMASALDKYGRSKLNNLFWVLLFGFITSVVATVVAARIFAARALKPMSNIVRQAERISFTNMGIRIHEGNGKDEIAQLAITFNRMLDRLQSSFESQRSFVSNASHELRTPLTSITGQLEVTLIRDRNPEEYREVLRSMLDDIRDLNQLVNSLLYLARANADDRLVRISEVRMDELVWQILGRLRKQHPDYEVELIYSDRIEDENNVVIEADEDLLRAALSNLIENGCKYSDPHRCVVTLEPESDRLHVRIEDRGLGIDPADLPHVFEPFYRSQQVTRKGGHGLGLPLARRIVQIHHGELTITSAPGTGTRVELSLPFRQRT
jgi:signal transduction histidine kinase